MSRWIRMQMAATAIVREHLPVLVLAVIYVSSALFIDLFVAGRRLIHLRWSYSFLNIFAVIFCACSLAVGLCIKARLFSRKRVGLGRAWREIRGLYLTPDSIAGFGLIYLMVPPFLSTFSSLKQTYPLLHPFRWDELFMRLDRFLHFGKDPWALVHPVLGYPVITSSMDKLYMLWFPLLFAFVIWMAFSSRRRLRAQFFVCLCLVWILLGNLAAVIFSSAGPCYYALVVRGNRDVFAPLMRYLQSCTRHEFLWAVANQQHVWKVHVKGTFMTFGGISAMPSLHVAVAVVFALVGRRVNQLAGLLFVAYCAIVQTGSVHLGWHYAIDGYLSIVLTPLLWRLSGKVLRVMRWQPVRDDALGDGGETASPSS